MEIKTDWLSVVGNSQTAKAIPSANRLTGSPVFVELQHIFDAMKQHEIRFWEFETFNLAQLWAMKIKNAARQGRYQIKVNQRLITKGPNSKVHTVFIEKTGLIKDF